MSRFLPSLLLLLPALAAAAPEFTGDVPADFGTDALVLPDPQGIDVGIPQSFPAGTISGWDIEDIRLSYDAATDTLYVGITTYGVAGDADGDGDPERTRPELAGIGGVDEPFLGGTEGFALMADLDEDNLLDIIVGVPAGADITGFGAFVFSGNPVAPSVSFGAPLAAVHQGLLFGAPSAAAPHLEFTVPGWSTLPTTSGALPGLDFNVGVFLGSLSDAGIGEDFFPGVFQFTPVDLSSCGDGIVDPGEECDDGNTLDLDGCSATCDTDPGYVCECAEGDALSLDLVGASGLFGATSRFQGLFECPPGEVMTGVTGLFIDNCPGAIVSMDPICGTAAVEASGDVIVSPQGAVPGPGPDAPEIALPHGTYTLSCPDDQVLVGFEGKEGIVSPFNPIRRQGLSELTLLCADPQVVGGEVVVTSTGTHGTPVGEGNPLPGDASISCGPGQIATGIGAWGGSLIDGARLICSAPTSACGAQPSVCREEEICGDGIVDSTEACDDGNAVNDDGCTNACALPVCGDGITQPGEACDDANDVDDDGCTNGCALPVCGDGITQPGEECDDGNTVEDDGCTNGCTEPACGDGIVQSGEACDDGNLDDDDACSNTCAEVCGLAVDKTCTVVPVPSVQDCDGKVTGVKFRYTGLGCGATTNFQSGKLFCTGDANGAEPVSVVVSDGGGTTWGTASGVLVGDVFEATAAFGGETDFSNETFITLTGPGGEHEEVEFHTSCSKPVVVGDQYGSFELIELSSTNGGTVTLPDTTPADSCSVSAPPGPHCTSKPTSVSLRYVGGSCADTTNNQSGSATCSGSAVSAEPVRIVVRKDAGTVYADVSGVSLGDVIVADAAGEYASNTEVRIYSAAGTLLQSIDFHTSCSKPLNLGDQFGAVQLVALDPKDHPPVSLGGTITYDYTVTNTSGVDAIDVVVTDDVLGELPGSPIPLLAAGESVTLSVETFVSDTVTNTVFVDGSTPGGATCAATDAVTVTVVAP